MFRRREDSLFDTPEQNEMDSPESVNAASPQPASSASAPASAPAPAPTPAYLSGASSPASAQPARPAAATANSFRPSSPASSPAAPSASELSRSRMPEAKPAMPAQASSPAASSFNMQANANKAGKRVLTVGNDILLKGEIATCDRLVIEGKVDATLNDVHTVEIAETGSFKGSAHIEDAEISGLFEGDLIVRNRLIIYATGKVRGKITYGEVEIERGGELSGEIKTSNPASQTAAARPARAKEEKVAA